MKKSLIFSLTMMLMLSIGHASAQNFEYKVKHKHIYKDCIGVLTVSAGGVEYKTSNKKDRRKWRFSDIRSFEVKSPTEISLVTYEDQKRWAGKDKVFEFILIDKKVTQDLTSFLLSSIARPMKLSVIPEVSDRPAYELEVKHLRTISGTRGMLRIYSDKVIYETSTTGDSRYWRISDIERFSHPDRFRFEIASFTPKAGGPTEAYNFQLIEDLPEGVEDYLWLRLHPSSYYPEIKR